MIRTELGRGWLIGRESENRLDVEVRDEELGLADDKMTTRTESSTASSSTMRAVSMNCSNVNRLIGGWSNTTRAIPASIDTPTAALMTPPVVE